MVTGTVVFLAGYLVTISLGAIGIQNYSLKKKNVQVDKKLIGEKETIYAVNLPPTKKIEIPEGLDNKAILNFIETLKTKTGNQISLSSLENNLKTLEVVALKRKLNIKENIEYFKRKRQSKKEGIEFTEERPELFNLSVSGRYYTYQNKIETEGKMNDVKNNTFYHELLHMASTYRDEVGNRYCGFCNYIKSKEYNPEIRDYIYEWHSFGDGLNEGMTEHLARKYFGGKDGIFEAYSLEVDIVRLISDILGEEFMEKNYFSSNIKNVMNELQRYAPGKTDYEKEQCIRTLIGNIDEVNDKKLSLLPVIVMTPKNKQTISMLFAHIGETLYSIKEAKVLKEIEDPQKAFEEINSYAEKLMNFSKKNKHINCKLLSEQNYRVHLEALKLAIMKKQEIKNQKDNFRKQIMDNLDYYKENFARIRFKNDVERFKAFIMVFGPDASYNPRFFRPTEEEERKRRFGSFYTVDDFEQEHGRAM